MIKIICLSKPVDAPEIAREAGIQEGDLTLDGNLSPIGLSKLHDRVQRNVRNEGPGYTAVVVCTNTKELAAAIRDLVGRLGKIDLLDIVGHGAAGLQRVGDEALFEASAERLTTGEALAEQLNDWLAPHARLRLLGCKTACDEAGRMLLNALGVHLGTERTVYGTIERVNPPDFDTGVFSQERELLFSSEAATDQAAPNATIRNKNIERLAQAINRTA